MISSYYSECFFGKKLIVNNDYIGLKLGYKDTFFKEFNKLKHVSSNMNQLLLFKVLLNFLNNLIIFV